MLINRACELHHKNKAPDAKKKLACNKCGGTKCRLGHFRLVLTSKLATAGRQARSIATIKKKFVLTTLCLQCKIPGPVPKARTTITYNWARHKRYRHGERFNFPRRRSPVTSNWLLVTNSAFHQSIAQSLGGPCQLESCAAGKRTSGSTVVCVEYKRPMLPTW